MTKPRTGHSNLEADPSVVFATKTAIEWEDWAAARDVPLVALREDHAQRGS